MDEMWRKATKEELEILENCEASDFTVFESPNAGDFWITCDSMDLEEELTTGWFETEEEAYQWLEEGNYSSPDTNWLLDDIDL